MVYPAAQRAICCYDDSASQNSYWSRDSNMADDEQVEMQNLDYFVTCYP